MGFKVATVKIRNKKTGKIKTINANEYAMSGGFASGAWELVGGERRAPSDAPLKIETSVQEPATEVETPEAVIEKSESDSTDEKDSEQDKESTDSRSSRRRRRS